MHAKLVQPVQLEQRPKIFQAEHAAKLLCRKIRILVDVFERLDGIGSEVFAVFLRCSDGRDRPRMIQKPFDLQQCRPWRRREDCPRVGTKAMSRDEQLPNVSDVFERA